MLHNLRRSVSIVLQQRDLLKEIFSHLDLNDLENAKLVCIAWYKAVRGTNKILPFLNTENWSKISKQKWESILSQHIGDLLAHFCTLPKVPVLTKGSWLYTLWLTLETASNVKLRKIAIQNDAPTPIRFIGQFFNRAIQEKDVTSGVSNRALGSPAANAEFIKILIMHALHQLKETPTAKIETYTSVFTQIGQDQLALRRRAQWEQFISYSWKSFFFVAVIGSVVSLIDEKSRNFTIPASNLLAVAAVIGIVASLFTEHHFSKAERDFSKKYFTNPPEDWQAIQAAVQDNLREPSSGVRHRIPQPS